MGLDEVEQSFTDVLQNIEMAVVGCYRDDPELTDWDVAAAYEAMLRTVRARADGREASRPSLGARSAVVYEAVAAMVAWRLGDVDLTGGRGRPDLIEPADMVLCLKRLQRSLRMWNKQGGRRGYLNYIGQFL